MGSLLCIRQGQNPPAAPVLGWILPICRQQIHGEGQMEVSPCTSSRLVLCN